MGEPTVFDPSPEIAATADVRQLVGILMGGTRSVRRRGSELFPPMKNEDRGAAEPGQDTHSRRVARAVVEPFYRRAVRRLAGQVFAKPLHLQDDVPEEIRGRLATDGVAALEGWQENIDLRGHNLQQWAHSTFRLGLAYGFVAGMVDCAPLPQGLDPERVSKADEEKRRPYWVRIRPGELLEATWIYVNGVKKLARARRLETFEEPAGPWGKTTGKQARVLYRGSPETSDGVDRFVRYEIWRKGEKAEDAPYIHSSGAMRPLTEIPLAVFPAEDEDECCEPEDACYPLPLLLDLAFQNVHHLRVWSEEDAYLKAAKRIYLWRSGVDAEKAELKQFSESSGRVVYYTSKAPGEAGFEVHETTGAAAGVARQARLDLEDAMRRESLEPLMKDRAQTLGERVLDTTEVQSALEVKAEAFKDFLEQMLMFTAAWRGMDTGGSVKLNTEYGMLRTEQALLAANQAARDRGDISQRTYLQYLAEAGGLPEDFNFEEEVRRLAEESVGAEGYLAAQLEELRAEIAGLKAGRADPLPPSERPGQAPPAELPS